MKIRMIKNTRVAVDGLHSELWAIGRVEVVVVDLAQSLIKGQHAVAVRMPRKKRLETPEDPGGESCQV